MCILPNVNATTMVSDFALLSLITTTFLWQKGEREIKLHNIIILIINAHIMHGRINWVATRVG